MLAVISDLHFEEEQSDAIPDPAGVDKDLALARNIPARAFCKVFAELAVTAERTGAKRLDLVLAGDTIDLHRTGYWFERGPHPPELRPYVDCADLRKNPALEAKTLWILERIAAEPAVSKTLEVIRLLAGGSYLVNEDDHASLRPFGVPVTLHFLPGNHDRLTNATENLRRRVRELLGMPASDAPFPHVLTFADPRVLVRHGHEYDRFNFSEDYEEFEPFPETIPEAHYDAPCLGDFITVEVAARLPVLFRAIHGDGVVYGDPVLRQVYLRLLEFDDVRPQAALIPFLLSIPNGPPPDAVWDTLVPVVRQLLDELSESEYLDHWLHWLHLKGVRLLLRSKVWKSGLVLGLLEKHAGTIISSGGGQPAEQVARREAVVRNGKVRFVIAGHTHHPQVALAGRAEVAGQGQLESYFVDTGTWRKRIMLAGDPPFSGRVKALTYATVYASTEDRGHPPISKSESFDYWSGFTNRWESE